MQDQSIDVFLSYASEDRAKAAALVEGLKQHGLTVWWDAELRPNEEFSPAIEAQIDAARAVVVLWTVSSVKKSFVKEEAVRAQSKLVPVLLDESQPPLGFGQVSHVNLRRWNGDALSPDLDRLIESIGKVGGSEKQWRKPATWLVLRGLFRDLKTRIGLSLVVGLVFVAWLAWGRVHWHEEDFQWAILFGLCASLAWLLMRGNQLARSRVGLVCAVTLAVVALGGSAFRCYAYYKVPEFPAKSAGILVARFREDVADDKQLGWVAQLRAQQASESISADAREAFEPVSIQLLRREIRGDDIHAHRLLNESGALLAIWGREDKSVAMTFADLPGFAKLDGLAISPISSVRVNDDPQAQSVISQSVLLFSSAFAAFRDEDYELAQQLLQRIPERLRGDRSMLTSTASMLATAHLLMGNIHMFAGCEKADTAHCVEAIDHYMNAREIFSKGEDVHGNLFVEASNNFAVATFKLTSSFVTSQTELNDAEHECQKMRANPPLACAFVRYNLALLNNETGEYRMALAKLAEVCPEHVDANTHPSGSAFVGECHQQQAYASAKLGESTISDTEAAQHFISAQTYLDLAVAALPDKDHAGARLKVSITRARIAIGQREFVAARDLLKSLMADGALDPAVARRYPELDAAEISALYAVARVCTQAIGPHQAEFAASLSPAALNYVKRRIEGCYTSKETLP